MKKLRTWMMLLDVLNIMQNLLEARCKTQGHEGKVITVEFIPDRKQLASGSGDMMARGLKKNLKRLNALNHWMLVKLDGTFCVKIRVIQTPLFVSGINIFLQVLFGTRLLAVIGGSSADTVPILCIIRDSSLQRINEPHERFLHSMMETQGVLIVAASL
ncbi:hypothetical protein C5167_039859 [Papaver somniferum]|uniref:Small ribosomal subunit protein eS4 N-terminal domain-containing protein n=1 Tax=Papaver somniferum TaxID=3469 RepID=A0A4Y7IHH5_PAPSO|nr:hypothetical protein C5167_039859 [Papaver somniferum]